MERLKYFFRINIRNLFTFKKFAFVNIIGLSIGLIVSLLIFLYVRYETSFDNFNPDAKNIYRIVARNLQDGSVGASTPLALSDVLKKDFPEIDKVVGLMRTWKEIKVDDARFEDINGAIVEKEFFGIFNIPLLVGNKAAIFQDPYEIVITNKLADKLFGHSDPIGKTIEYENHLFTVVAIINSIPSNSIFDFDYFISDKYKYISYTDLNQRWYHFGLYSFITFKGNKVPADFELKLANIEKQYYPDFMKNRHKYLIVNFKGSHLNPVLKNDLKPSVAPGYLGILSAVAIGILIIACLNFINISIANYRRRSIETGIKKVYGASSAILVSDFFFEISIIVLISLVIAFMGIDLLLPYYNDLIGKHISINFSDPVFLGGVAAFSIITILISGLYPSIVLSKPSPARVILHYREPVKYKMAFQKCLVVLQFTISIILVVTQLFIFKQISFMQNAETGFDKKNLITMPVTSLGDNDTEQLKNTNLYIQTLEKYQAQYGFGKISITEFVPGFGFRNQFKIYPDDQTFQDGFELLSCDVDESFIDVFGLHIVEGRFFSRDFPNDYNDAIIINESAYKKLGWKSIEGKSVGLFSEDNRKEVVGVINDMNIKSLQYGIDPMIYQFGNHHNYPGYITVRLESGKEANAIKFFGSKWTELFPGIPFKYESIEEKYKAAYGEEEKLAKIIRIFSVFAMLISLLGIFALSALECDRRTKEVGIRKVNGAGISEIIAMLNKDFLKWVAIAFIIAIPVSFYIINRWLHGFALQNRTELVGFCNCRCSGTVCFSDNSKSAKLEGRNTKPRGSTQV